MTVTIQQLKEKLETLNPDGGVFVLGTTGKEYDIEAIDSEEGEIIFLIEDAFDNDDHDSEDE